MRGYKKTSEEYRDEAKTKAFASLAGHRFHMFGHWAETWVLMNKLCRFRKPNPFNKLVELARKMK